MPQHDPDYPSVTVHYAQTLDGRIATRTGHSQWISGGDSLRLAHQLRAEHAAVLVGVGTVLADDPRLTLRLAPGVSPARVVVDSTLRLPLTATILSDGAARTIVATTERADAARVQAVRERGSEVLIVEQDSSGRVDLIRLLPLLRRLDILSLLIEGGATVITAALRAHLVDRLVVCIAPKLLGQGIEAVGDLDITSMDDALQFERVTYSSLGDDIILDGRLTRERVPSA